MAVGAKEEETTEKPVPATPVAGTPVVVPVVTPEPVKAGAKPEVVVTPTVPTAHKVKDDEEIPENAELLELTSKAFKSRLARHTKKELRERFGTDDANEIKAKLARLDELENKEEESRRAALDEKTRLEEDLAKANSRAEQAEFRSQQLHENQLVDKEESRIVTLGKEVMDPEEIEDQLPKLARYLKKEFTEKQLRKLPDSKIAKWFADQVEKRPKLGKDYESKSEAAAKAAAKQAAKDAEKPRVKVPLNSGSKGNARPAPATGSGSDGKTFKPGQTNSMTSQEARAQARKQGLQW